MKYSFFKVNLYFFENPISIKEIKFSYITTKKERK